MTVPPTPRACRVTAFAKVNLDLRVRGVRPDGYHELATVFQSIALGDVLTIEPRESPGLEIACDDPAVPRDGRNLVWRAAHGLCRTLDVDLPAMRVRIEKAIPTEAGLGGGSADAAAMLAGLNVLLGSPAPPDRLAAVAATLGADVPFMLTGGAAVGTGRGDVLHALPDLPPFEVVVVHPGFGVSTSEAYGWYDEAANAGAATAGHAILTWPSTSDDWGRALETFENDLERPVAERHPEIAALVAALRAGGATLAAMTGSGSAVFGLFAPGGAAVRVARRLGGEGRFVTVVPTLGRADFEHLTTPALVGENA